MNPITVYVDPGIVGSGLSAFAGTELLHAAYVPNTVGTTASSLARRVRMARALVAKLVAWGIDLAMVVTVGAEDPKVRDAGHQRDSKRAADPNDLLNLTGVTAAFAVLVGPVPGGLPPDALYAVEPSAWKGTLDKDVMCAKVWGRLTAEERARVERTSRRREDPDAVPGGLTHNALDAVGVGLHFLGRLERVRYFAP